MCIGSVCYRAYTLTSRLYLLPVLSGTLGSGFQVDQQHFAIDKVLYEMWKYLNVNEFSQVNGFLLKRA